MSTQVAGFQSFSGFLHHFVLAKLATSSIRVKRINLDTEYCKLEVSLKTYERSIELHCLFCLLRYTNMSRWRRFLKTCFSPTHRPVMCMEHLCMFLPQYTGQIAQSNPSLSVLYAHSAKIKPWTWNLWVSGLSHNLLQYLLISDLISGVTIILYSTTQDLKSSIRNCRLDL